MCISKVKKIVVLSLFSVVFIVGGIVGCSNKKESKSSDNSTSEFFNNTFFDKELDTNKLNEAEITDVLKIKEKIKLYKLATYTADDIKPSDRNEYIPLFYENKKINFNKEKDSLFKKVLRSNIANLVRIDINIISISEKYDNIDNILFAYTTNYINPKLEVVYFNVDLMKNDNNKFELYGEIKLKNVNLDDKELNFLKEYSKLYPNVVKFEGDNIIINYHKS